MSVHNSIKYLCGAALFTVCGAQSRSILNSFDRGTFTPLPVSAPGSGNRVQPPLQKWRKEEVRGNLSMVPPCTPSNDQRSKEAPLETCSDLCRVHQIEAIKSFLTYKMPSCFTHETWFNCTSQVQNFPFSSKTP